MVSIKAFRRLVLAATMLGATGAGAAASNQQLVIATTQEFESLNPLIMQMAASNYISAMVDRPLMIIDGKWNWNCELCVKVPSIENGLAKIVDDKGTKKLRVEWELKPGLKWGDGKPVTGHDFKLTWEIGKSPNVSVGSKDAFERIEAVEVDAKNPLKFTTVYKEPRYDFYQLSINPMPSHLEGPIWEKTKDQTGAYEKQTVYTTDPTNAGLYNGPYVVTELKLGSHVVVRKNANFGGSPAQIEKIIVKLIPNTQTLEAALLSGEIDMVGELGMSFDQAVEFEKRMAKDSKHKDSFKTLFRDGLTYEHVDLNLRNPVLQDKNVRKALMHAIDREKLTQALFSGKQKAALSNFHPLDPYYSADAIKYEPDQKKAAALLDEAGWKVGAGGIRTKDGKKLELTIMTTSDNKTRELVEQYIQAELKKVGIQVAIKNEPARVFFGETVRKGAYPALAMFAWVSSPDSPPRSTLHSKEIPTKENSFNGQNSGAFANKRADEILEEVFREFDFAKRKALMAELQKIYTDEVPTIPLYLRASIAVIPANLTGFELTGHLFYSTLAVEKWALSGKASH
jgi:peptide/nickel transport system substrate-binding protein